jgi:hypothetical protein
MTQCSTCGADPCANPSFCAVCRKADAEKKPRQDPHMHRLRKLMEPDISLERAWAEISRAASERYNNAPEATWNAVQYELRTCGLQQLSNPSCQRRLADLSIAQIKNLMASLLQWREQYPNVSDELLAALAEIYDARIVANEQ